MAKMFRKLPSVSELLESPSIKKLLDSAGDNSVVAGVQAFVDQVRGELQSAAERAPEVGELADQIAKWIAGNRDSTFQAVINATGTILPQQLGRSPLGAEVVDQIAATASGYCNLTAGSAPEIRQQAAVETALQSLVGAESAIVVQSHAAATLLALSVAAAGDVILGRGEVSRVGGCDIDVLCRQAGVRRLTEVGAVDRMTWEHYRDAVIPETRALLRVHASTYEVAGDTSTVETRALSSLARQRKLPLIVSLESGAVVDLTRYGVQAPTVPDVLNEGADLVAFAGDQLFGGPSCGLLVGRHGLLARIRNHPLLPLFQVDKLTLAAIDATVRIYREQDQLESRLPLLELLSTSAANLRHRAERLATQLKALTCVQDVAVVDGYASLMAELPSQRLPTWQLLVDPAEGSGPKMAARLRQQAPAVWPLLRRQQLILDLRAVKPADDERLLEAFCNLQNQADG